MDAYDELLTALAYIFMFLMSLRFYLCSRFSVGGFISMCQSVDCMFELWVHFLVWYLVYLIFCKSKCCEWQSVSHSCMHLLYYSDNEQYDPDSMSLLASLSSLPTYLSEDHLQVLGLLVRTTIKAPWVASWLLQ